MSMEPPAELSELMDRIRAAVKASQHAALPADEPARRPFQPPLPEPLPTPPKSTVDVHDARALESLTVTLAEAASMLPRARQKTEIGAGVPKILRPAYRNQGGFNGIVLAAMERLVEASGHLQSQYVQMQERVSHLESAVAHQHGWMTAVTAAHERQREWMAAVELSLLELGGSQGAWEQRLKSLKEKSSPQEGLPVNGQAVNERHPAAFQELSTQLTSVDDHVNRLGDHLRNLQAQVDDHSERYANWHSHYRQTTAHHDLLDQMTRRLEERQHNDASYLKNQLWFLQRLVQPLLTKDTPAAAPGPVAPPSPEEHEFDALYLAFEEAMRGSRSELKERIRVYLPHVAAADAGTLERPVLDLGCGRGEWLELLLENGLAASGVDLNACMIEVCQERGLPVTQANALDHLANLPDASCGAVTAFHLIEHLPFPVLIQFLRECRRVLQPGGVAIFETPNPHNVLVGSAYFYHDFTHQRPLPPTSTKFLAEQVGFSKVEILPLNPWDEAAKVHGEGDKALESRFNELFYGPQDYALIATP